MRMRCHEFRRRKVEEKKICTVCFRSVNGSHRWHQTGTCITKPPCQHIGSQCHIWFDIVEFQRSIKRPRGICFHFFDQKRLPLFGDLEKENMETNENQQTLWRKQQSYQYSLTVYVSLMPTNEPLPLYIIITWAFIRSTCLIVEAETTRQHVINKVTNSIFQSGFIWGKLQKGMTFSFSSFLVLIVIAFLFTNWQKDIFRLDIECWQNARKVGKKMTTARQQRPPKNVLVCPFSFQHGRNVSGSTFGCNAAVIDM